MNLDKLNNKSGIIIQQQFDSILTWYIIITPDFNNLIACKQLNGIIKQANSYNNLKTGLFNDL